MNGRRLLGAVAALLLVALLFCCGLTIYVGERLTHPTRVPLATTPASVGLAYSNVTLKARTDGTRLSGWWLPDPGSRRTIVFAHGYASNRLEATVPALAVAAALHAHGFNVLMFDFRASGKSGGSVVTVGGLETRDLLGAVDYARSRTGDGPLGVLGWSMGASTALQAAERDPDVAAVVADSPFADLTTYLRADLPVWTHLPAFPFTPLFFALVPPVVGVNPAASDPLKDMAALSSRAVLLIAGKADTTVPPVNARELAAADSSARLWLVPGAAHIRAFHVDPAGYLRHVLATFAAVH